MSTDVNAEFDAQRRDQIAQAYADKAAAEKYANDNIERMRAYSDRLRERAANGELRDNGDGTYTSVSGWDAGEVFRTRMINADGQVEIPLLLPQAGLDMTADGQGIGFFGQPEWHELGKVYPGGSTDIELVLKESGLDYEVLQKETRYHAGGKWRTAPGSFVNYRGDTFEALGTVGKIYTPFQNRDAFAFLNEVAAMGLNIVSAAPLDGGKRVFITAELPDEAILDINGTEDRVRMYLAFLNDHSGNGQVKTIMTPWRIRCTNTERLALENARTSWGTRHTKNAKERAAEAARTLGLAHAYVDEFVSEEQVLAQFEVELSDIWAVLGGLWPEELPRDEQTNRERMAAERRDEAIIARFNHEAAVLGGESGYAFERAITGYIDNDKNRNAGNYESASAARGAAAITGADDTLKAKAHKALMALAA